MRPRAVKFNRWSDVRLQIANTSVPGGFVCMANRLMPVFAIFERRRDAARAKLREHDAAQPESLQRTEVAMQNSSL